MQATGKTTEYEELLASTLADIQASEPDDALEPTFIDRQLDMGTTVWYIAYSTS